MSQVSSFLKTTFLGGVVAIVPLSAIAFILWSIYSVMVEVVGAMEGVLPFSPFVNTLIVGAAALLGLVMLCFAAGLALRTAVGNRIKESVDALLERFVPLYSAAKKMTSRLAGEATSEFTPAEIDIHGTGATRPRIRGRRPPGRSNGGLCTVLTRPFLRTGLSRSEESGGADRSSSGRFHRPDHRLGSRGEAALSGESPMNPKEELQEFLESTPLSDRRR